MSVEEIRARLRKGLPCKEPPPPDPPPERFHIDWDKWKEALENGDLKFMEPKFPNYYEHNFKQKNEYFRFDKNECVDYIDKVKPEPIKAVFEGDLDALRYTKKETIVKKLNEPLDTILKEWREGKK